MSAVTISSNYTVVIPKDVRDRLAIRAGQRVEVFAIDGRIELVPLRPVEDLRGFLRGVTVPFDRELDREL